MAQKIFDAVLIDQVFQPVADWLETRDISIFSVARFFLDGASAFFIGNFALAMIWIPQFDFILMSVGVIALFLVIVVINRLLIKLGERVVQRGMLNPNRHLLQTMRICCLLYFISGLLRWTFVPNIDYFLSFMGWLCWTMGVYFASCERRPKIRQTNKLPANFVGQAY
jgi:hypothetical protein